MRKEIVGDGITKVLLGKEEMTWFVASQKLQADVIRPDVQTTEISVAFTLQESDNGAYIPHLDQQPVFSFLPLRKYGLKFIIQGDFVLPSSREEVDGDSPWNQWLLSQFPDLFVSAERSFCALSCFRENPGKAVTAFMNFVPLVGEVHGFFSTLPRMIISKLRTSKCLLLEGDNSEWVPPCKVLRSWNEQAHTLLPDNLLREHLGLGFLDKNIVLSDSLASALGIEEYGPKILLQIISSLCHTVNGLKSMGLDWLSSWLNTLHTMLLHSFSLSSLNFGMESDLINTLKKIPFIPLSDGTYGSVDDGTIWLHSDASSTGFDNGHGLEAFPKLYAKLRIVSPALFGAAAAVDVSCYDSSLADNITRMLHRVGRPFNSSFISSLCDVRWIASSMDDELHYPKDLFYDCDAVRSILGASAPYAVPKVRSEKLLSDIGFKTQVNLDDILVVLQLWRRSETPFMASIAQMSKLYTFVRNEMATSKQKIAGELHSGPSIFVPYSGVSRHEDVVPGVFLSPQEVYWHDSTGSMDKMMEINPRFGSSVTHCPLTKTLCNIYPGLHDFFVYDCGVDEIPPLRSYLQILQQLSTIALPSQVAKMVFRVFLKWSEGLKSGLLTYEDIVYLKEHLLKLEWTVLPIVQDKWVSLHPSFGLVCWCDDEKLRKEFKNFENIDFLYFGELNDDEEEMFQVKISVLMQTLGIPALSKVVTREAIYYGPADCSLKASLVNWALPYAQRYIHNVHPNKYIQLKQSGAENLSHLQIVVVEKLFYRNVIKRSGIASEKRFECSCLLQGNLLYTTRESDSHSIFMEISRLLFDGTPELHLANFLHMITTMAESGSTEEQTEFFILNSQKVPRLPDEESVWSLSSVPSSTENDTFLMNFSSTVINEQNPSKSKRKPGISSNWPPVDWKTAPGFSFARASGLQAQAVVPQPSSCLQLRMKDGSEDTVAETDPMAKGNADWTIEDDPVATTTACLQDFETSEDPSHQACDLVASGMDLVVDSVDLVTPSDGPNLGSLKSSERDQLSFGTPNIQQTMLTGRLGEHVAFNYFAANFGKTIVKWVNEVNETGLPYDIVIGNEAKTMEYIEVKATKSARKDWFTISVREWQFAVEKGESYSIARVVLSGNNMARIRIFKNPVRLSQLGKLQLAVIMPKQEKEFSVVS
ncbi:hypothetical protein F0562_000076 [Nyssa sinensis]|uniref:Protein NO VEIN C-terminal domain-containing protein n=1 Tax=Nyssa sinensis TaxID=561372 RepID=A0A5J5C3A7_9ASTE|nr:hypothetical protein F0562_000076 [Nyssa sinensis]